MADEPVAPTSAAETADVDTSAESTENSSGSYLTDYVKIAAFLAGALAYGPVLNAWLSTIGSRYYDVITSDVGLSSNALDLDDRAIVARGYELLVQATNPFVSGVVIGLPFAFFVGLILGAISSAYDIKRKGQIRPRYDKTTVGRWIVATGRISLIAGSILFVSLFILAAVFLAPGIATDSANRVLNCAKDITKADCAPPFDYNNSAQNARFLVADKSAVYVYQDYTVHRIKLEDVKTIFAQARPKPVEKPNAPAHPRP